jgi:hypothetical protein
MWYIEGGGVYSIDGEDHWGRNFFVEEKEADKIRKRFNNIEAYCTYFKYDSKEQISANKIGPFIADLDIKINSEFEYAMLKQDVLLIRSSLYNTFKVPYEMIKLYFSGNKGFHIEVDSAVFGIKPCSNLHEQYKALGAKLKSDTMYKTLDIKIYEYRRLLRLPNSINKETGLYKVPIDYDFLIKSTYEDMKVYASKEQHIKTAPSKLVAEAKAKYDEFIKAHFETENKRVLTSRAIGEYKRSEYPPCVKEILSRGAVSGQRNATAFALASSLLQKGSSLEETINTVLDWNKEKNVPPSPDGELMRTVTSANVGLNSGRRYGCGGIQELGYCTGQDCPIKRYRQNQQAQQQSKKQGGNKSGRRKQIIQ